MCRRAACASSEQWISEIRADLVTRIVQPGRFVPLSSGALTLHIRERLPNGQLLGIFIDDQRDPKERVTFLAEQGDIITKDDRHLSAARGRQRAAAAGRGPDPNIVQFDRYAFDLSQLSSETQSHPEIRVARALSVGALSVKGPMTRPSTTGPSRCGRS